MVSPGPTALAPPVRRHQFRTQVVANVPLCREHFRLVLTVPQFPPTEPGQFIQIACRDMDADYATASEMPWDSGQPVQAAGAELLRPLAMLRRPFSLAGRRDTGGGGVELD